MVRIASWNIDSIRARMALVERWIDTNRPDVLCLQETKVSDRLFPRASFLERGYELAVGDSGGYGGVAMMSKAGLDRVTIGIPGATAPLAECRTISATVAGLRIHTVYGPNGRKAGTRPHDIKLAWLDLFRAWVQMDGLDEGQATMVIGDLNIAPADIDVWEARRYRNRNLTSPPERESFQKLLDIGLVDVIRRHYGDEAVFTWWNRRSDFYETDRGWRLDHALVDTETAERVTRAIVDRAERGREGSSDHAPLVVDLT